MKTILVADDEYAVVEALAALLGDEGYRVVTAADGIEALDVLAEDRPDLVLLDVMMPRLDGRAVLRAMRADPRWASIPVIVMSAAARPIDEDHLGHAVFLRKPFELDELLRLVEEGLAKTSV